MTTILIDEFQGNFYVFSDGVISRGNTVVTRDFVKSHVLEDGRIIVSCGIVGSVDIAMEILKTDQLNESHYSQFQGNCTLLIVSSEYVEMHVVNSTDVNGIRYNSGYTGYYTKDSFPLFHGSGCDFLMGAYFALLRDKPDNEHDYLELVGLAFKAHCERLTDAGELLTTRKLIRV